MRVAIFSDTYMCQNSTGQIYPLRDTFPIFIGRLIKYVDHLTLASRLKTGCDDPGALWAIPQNERLNFAGLPFYANTQQYYARLVAILPKALPLIWDILKNSDVVVIRIHHCMAAPIALCALAAKKPLVFYWAGSIKHVVETNYPGSSAKDRIARIAAKIETTFFRFLTPFVSTHFFIDPTEHAEMGYPKNTTFVAPNLVQPADVSENGALRVEGPLRLVFAGRLFRSKGLFELLEALKTLGQRGIDVVLDIAGSGPESKDLRVKATSSGLNNVHFVGQLPREQLFRLMNDGHVFILPSYSESIPKVMWEAWAAGMALVITGVGGIKHHVVDGINGLLIIPGSASSIVEAIEKLAQNENLRLRIAQAGRQKIINTYNWDSQVFLIAETLSELCLVSQTNS